MRSRILFLFCLRLMITIDKIKLSDNHISLELDNGETLDILNQVADLYMLESGRRIDTTEYAQLKEESQRFRCNKKALDYLAVRNRSANEMERYLYKKGFAHNLIREVVNSLGEAGYIDDYDYATRFINNKLNKKLIGKHLLARELQKKGIARTIIKQVLKESEFRLNNIDEIYETAVKKYNTLKLKKNGLSKLAYFLQRRGFDAEVVNVIITRITHNK